MVPLEPNEILSIPCASGVQDIITVLIDQKKGRVPFTTSARVLQGNKSCRHYTIWSTKAIG